jgi:hypothetical protein
MRRPRQLLSQRVRRGLIAALVALCLTGCRGQGPEAGLDPALFERPDAALTSNARGQWFVLSPAAASHTPLVVVTYKEDRKLFYALPRGRRAMELLPLSPVMQSWFTAAMDCSCAQVTMLEDPSVARLSDPIGLADEMGGVTWLGPQPRGAVQAVFMPPAMGNAFVPLRRLSRGVGFVTAEGKLGGAKVAPGSLVIADGEVRAEQTVRVLSLEGDPPAMVLGETVKLGVAPPGHTFEPFEPRYARTGQVLGRRLGADILLSLRDGEGWRVQLVEPNATALASAANMAPAIAEAPLEVVGEEDDALLHVMRGVLAVRRGHPLVAYMELDPARIAVEGGSQAATLRVEELLGAAQWTQWMRVARMDGQTYLQAPDFYYMARAMVLERGLQSGDRLSKSALASFGYWSDPAGSLGKARSWALLGEIARRRGHTEDALIAAQEAARLYVVAGDVLRAADMELFAAQLALALGKPDRALELVELARSRYYHGHFVYGCALAELAMAELHTAAGRGDEALKLAGYALKRMEKLAEPIGINRAQIVTALIERALGQDRQRELEEGLARALQLRDPVGAARAGAALVNSGRVLARESVWPLGLAIMDGLPAMQQQIGGDVVQRALATLCAQGLPQSAEAAQADALQLRRAQIACQEAMGAGALAEDSTRGWIEDGYRSVQLGDDAMARLRASQLADLLTDGLAARAPQQAAEIWLLRAVVAGETPEGEAAFEQALATLDKHLDPALIAEALAASAAMMVERGQHKLAVSLYQRALAQALAQRQEVIALETALTLADAQLGAGELVAVASTLRTAEALLPAVGARADALRVRVLLTRAAAAPDAQIAAGLRAEARERIARLPAEAQVALGLEDARRALSASLWQEAAEAFDRVERTIVAMPEALASTVEMKRQLGWALIGQAEVALYQGRYAQTIERARRAELLLSEDPAEEALRARGVALRLIVQVMPVGEIASAARAELLILSARQPTANAQLGVAYVWRALAALALEMGDVEGARTARQRVRQLGLAPAVASQDAACLSAALEEGEAQLAALALCAAGSGEGARQARLRQIFLMEGAPAVRQAALDALTLRDGARWSARQRATVATLVAATRGRVAWREADERRLREALAKAPAGDLVARTRAADALISYLLDVGRAASASAILEQERASLMQGDEESATLLACSEVLLGLAELAPLSARSRAAYEALAAWVPDAPMLVLRARRARALQALALGELGRARIELAGGLEAARAAKDLVAERELIALIAQLYPSP